MAAVKDAKNMKLFDNELALIECVHDFAKDGGAVGALDMLTAKEAMVIHNAVFKVKTAYTSGGSATLSIGKSGDAAGIVAATAVASLTEGALIDSASFGSGYKLAANDVVQVAIAVAAMTAGKGQVALLVSKF